MKLSLLCSIGLLMAAPLTAQSGDQSVKVALDLLQQSQTQAAAGHLDVAAELAAAAQEILSAQQSESVQTHHAITGVAGRVLINTDGLVRVAEAECEGQNEAECGDQAAAECEDQAEAECEVEIECEITEECDDSDFDFDFGDSSFMDLSALGYIESLDDSGCADEPQAQHVWTTEPPHADHHGGHGGNPHMRRGGHPRMQDGGDVRMQLQAVQLELQALRLELQALRMQMGLMRGGMGHGMGHRMGPQKQMLMRGMMMPQMQKRMQKRMQMQMHGMMMPDGEWFSDGENCGGADGDWDPDFDLEAELEELLQSGSMGLEDAPQLHSEMRLIINGEVFEGEAAQEKLEELGVDAEMDHQIHMKIVTPSQSQSKRR